MLTSYKKHLFALIFSGMTTWLCFSFVVLDFSITSIDQAGRITFILCFFLLYLIVKPILFSDFDKDVLLVIMTAFVNSVVLVSIYGVFIGYNTDIMSTGSSDTYLYSHDARFHAVIFVFLISTLSFVCSVGKKASGFGNHVPLGVRIFRPDVFYAILLTVYAVYSFILFNPSFWEWSMKEKADFFMIAYSSYLMIVLFMAMTGGSIGKFKKSKGIFRHL